MKIKPTFELLRERRELMATYPATGARFTVSLRSWQDALWAVKVIPDSRRASDRHNLFTKKHCIMSRLDIEDWMERLHLAA